MTSTVFFLAHSSRLFREIIIIFVIDINSYYSNSPSLKQNNLIMNVVVIEENLYKELINRLNNLINLVDNSIIPIRKDLVSG